MAETRAPIVLIAGGRGMDRFKRPDPLLQAVFNAPRYSRGFPAPRYSRGFPAPRYSRGFSRSTAGRPRVAYLGAASGDNAAFRILMSGLLKRAGAWEVTLAPLCGRRGDVEEAKAVLEASDLVFVSGGDVEEGMRVLEEKGMMPYLKRLHRAGKPFFGVSAGSIMLARTWIRWKDPDDDSSAELFPCMGFARVLCDTHGEADDWSELKALLALSPVGAVGHGIVSGSAISVDADGAVSALGGEVHRFRRRAGGVVQIESLLPAKRPGAHGPGPISQ